MDPAEIVQTTGTASPSDYVPAVGDLVEFKWGDSKEANKGIIYQDDDELRIADDEGTVPAVNWSSITILNCVGHTNKMDGIQNCSKASNIAQAYFAFTPTGSYEERQAQWVAHYGLKGGDLVKVVRGYKNGEFEGFHGIDDTERNDTKASSVGKVRRILSLGRGVYLDCEEYNFTFPYFALEPVK